ncbi:hypothetical protein RBSH_05331 [Rhodopirellula baltica SH28]|uniref:Uncharacterized protein n=2 Tax=Rhodopirellula baltica TaxID=265606 RepID=K5DA85_RHOBT|nr:hypothetical protein RBSH_05331 [Rhodopirellula baltica SH28]
MNFADFTQLRSRIERAHATIHAKAHVGFAKQQVAQDGSSCSIDVRGVKSPEQLEDEILNLFIWVWSMKDYLKELCRHGNVNPKKIEDLVNTESSLMIAADIANRSKHGELRQSRTGEFAKLQDVQIALPQNIIQSIGFHDSTIQIEVAIPDDAELNATIAFDSGAPSQNAFTVAQDAISAWETKAFPLVGA